MSPFKKQGLVLMSRMMKIIYDEHEDTPDHLLLDFCRDTYEVLFDTLIFMKDCNYPPPLEVLELLARFHRAADEDHELENKH